MVVNPPHFIVITKQRYGDDTAAKIHGLRRNRSRAQLATSRHRLAGPADIRSDEAQTRALKGPEVWGETDMHMRAVRNRPLFANGNEKGSGQFGKGW